MKTADKLKQFMKARQMVRFHSAFESYSTYGYVLDVGPKFFVLLDVQDASRYAGFICRRIADVRGLEADPQAAFAEKALKLRGLRAPRKPKVSLENITTLLESAGELFPLITIYQEKTAPDCCWIGRFFEIYRGWVALQEINPDASWDEEPKLLCKHGDITRVDFGGEYEESLLLVGGPAPHVED